MFRCFRNCQYFTSPMETNSFTLFSFDLTYVVRLWNISYFIQFWTQCIETPYCFFNRIPASPAKVSRKRPRSEALQLPILHQSKLRASRSKPQGCTTYTPQPILSPNRFGTGLYCNIKPKLGEYERNYDL